MGPLDSTTDGWLAGRDDSEGTAAAPQFHRAWLCAFTSQTHQPCRDAGKGVLTGRGKRCRSSLTRIKANKGMEDEACSLP